MYFVCVRNHNASTHTNFLTSAPTPGAFFRLTCSLCCCSPFIWCACKHDSPRQLWTINTLESILLGTPRRCIMTFASWGIHLLFKKKKDITRHTFQIFIISYQALVDWAAQARGSKRKMERGASNVHSAECQGAWQGLPQDAIWLQPPSWARNATTDSKDMVSGPRDSSRRFLQNPKLVASMGTASGWNKNHHQEMSFYTMICLSPWRGWIITSGEWNVLEKQES